MTSSSPPPEDPLRSNALPTQSVSNHQALSDPPAGGADSDNTRSEAGVVLTKKSPVPDSLVRVQSLPGSDKAGSAEQVEKEQDIRRSKRHGSGRNMAAHLALERLGDYDGFTDEEEASSPPVAKSKPSRRPTTKTKPGPLPAAPPKPPPEPGAAPGATPMTVPHPEVPAAAAVDPPAPLGSIPLSAGNPSELTKLIERFLYYFGHVQTDGSPRPLMLPDMSDILGVHRRRLYDVINVLEAIGVMRRVGKLQYEFCGYDHFPAFFTQLHIEEKANAPVEDRSKRAPNPTLEAPSSSPSAHAAVKQQRSNTHSLFVLSKKLVRMLIVSQDPISLSQIASLLVGEGSPKATEAVPSTRSQKQITIERRLYDIGCVLGCLGLVERIYQKKRQPAFKWTYGWRPGNLHRPPELEVSVLSKQPPPTLDLQMRASIAANKAQREREPKKERGSKRKAEGEATAATNRPPNVPMFTAAESSAALAQFSGGYPMMFPPPQMLMPMSQEDQQKLMQQFLPGMNNMMNLMLPGTEGDPGDQVHFAALQQAMLMNPMMMMVPTPQKPGDDQMPPSFPMLPQVGGAQQPFMIPVEQEGEDVKQDKEDKDE